MAAFNELKVGTEVYYTSDMLNESGFGVVIQTYDLDSWGQFVDIKPDNGHRMLINPASFHGPNPRLQLRSEYEATRDSHLTKPKE